jgi:hypothetical protein
MMKQEFVHETHEPAPPEAGIKWELIAVDIEGRDLEPEVPPSPREQTRLHDLPGLEAQQDGVVEAVRQIAQIKRHHARQMSRADSSACNKKRECVCGNRC